MNHSLSPGQVEALTTLRQHATETRFVLIGAAALGFHVELPRSTADVDLVLVAPPEQLDSLLTSLRWRRHPRIRQRWETPSRVSIDVLPVTDQIIEQGTLQFDNDGMVLSVVGFDLVLQHAGTFDVGTEKVEVASLPTLVVLKMAAWLDRPWERTRDLGDIAHVLLHALPEDDERRWEPPITDADLEFECQSAFFIAREIDAIAKDVHRIVVRDFLLHVESEDGPWFAQLSRELGFGSDGEGRAQLVLSAFRLGFD
jgi:predicted nucleotidyltransferase